MPIPRLDIDSFVSNHRTELETGLRVALAALALYNKPRPTSIGFAAGLIGLLEGESKSPEPACHCHSYINFLGGGSLNQMAALLIPAAYIISHLDRRLCCSTVEAAVVGATFGNWTRHKAREKWPKYFQQCSSAA